MTRFLLTLLALLTGLTAQNTPASARVVGAEVTIQLASSKRAAIVSQANAPQPRAQVWRSRQTILPALQPIAPAHTVLIGIDRARE
jgi:hypothetical protein